MTFLLACAFISCVTCAFGARLHRISRERAPVHLRCKAKRKRREAPSSSAHRRAQTACAPSSPCLRVTRLCTCAFGARRRREIRCKALSREREEFSRDAPRDSARVSPYLSCLLACLRRRRKKAQEGARRRKKAHDTRDSVTREIRCTACAPSSPKATQGEREENACACQLRLRRMRFGDKRDLVQGEREEFSRERLCTFFAEGDARRKSSPLAKEKRCAEFLERPPLRLRR